MVAVDIVEVGPRDGLQNERRVLEVDTRIELIRRMVERGAHRIEAASFVRPDRVPQMASAEEVLAGVPRPADVSYIGLVLNGRGAQRAVDAGCDEINVVVPVSEEFSRRNQGMGVAEMLGHAGSAIALARQGGARVSVTLAVAFGCPFSGVVDDRVPEIYDRVADLGLDEIAFADTVGVGVPRQVRELVRLVEADGRVPDLRFHFHNTRNTGYANAMAAWEATTRDRIALDASVGGFGGCPFAPRATGNIATEDLAYLMIGEGLEVDLDLADLLQDAEWLAAELGSPVQALLGRSGGFGTATPTGAGRRARA